MYVTSRAEASPLPSDDVSEHETRPGGPIEDPDDLDSQAAASGWAHRGSASRSKCSASAAWVNDGAKIDPRWLVPSPAEASGRAAGASETVTK